MYCVQYCITVQTTGLKRENKRISRRTASATTTDGCTRNKHACHMRLASGENTHAYTSSSTSYNDQTTRRTVQRKYRNCRGHITLAGSSRRVRTCPLFPPQIAGAKRAHVVNLHRRKCPHTSLRPASSSCASAWGSACRSWPGGSHLAAGGFGDSTRPARRASHREPRYDRQGCPCAPARTRHRTGASV